MSNYLIVIADERRSKEIQEWAEVLLTKKEEHKTVRLRAGVHMHYFARDAHSDVQETEGILFKGFAVDYENRAVVFGASGMRDFSNAHPNASRLDSIEGCHITASWAGPEITVRNDLFSVCSLLYTAENDFVAISDSAYILAALRKRFGYANLINSEAALARSWGNSMGGQLLSPDTIVEAIKYAPVGTTLRINFERLINLSVVRQSAASVFELRADSYAESMRLAGQRMASLMQTLSGVSVNAVRLALSGGMDSRVLLAAALLSSSGRAHTAFNCTNSNPSHATDYAVVSEMSEALGFPLGLRSTDTEPAAPTTRRVNETLGLWKLANAGIYDFLVLPNYVLNSVGAFSVSGHGAELHKGNYGWRAVQAIAANIVDPSVSAAFLSQTEKALSSLGVNVDSPIGSEWHYLAYRNALHSGQVSTTSMVGIRPLMMRDLVALNRSDVNQHPNPRKGQPSMVNDLLIMLSPEAAAFRFDVARKNMPAEYVESRAQELGGRLSEDGLDMYGIYGDFKTVSHGFPGVFQTIVQNDGRWVKGTRQAIADAMLDGYDRIDNQAVRAAYHPVLKEATMKLLDESLAYQQMRGSAGKLMSFNMLS
ncbi:hypothetical protein [Arthrobacter sp. SW1]|uniref:hypothetical protein n=1 Tax=Arthrobacter sp. SW1 TaxID=1920889 RepID=UPI0011131A86|nr:hypothetical protein [Arthrobacter sp. SW1]